MDRPDILWIVTTQWRADATGYAGNLQARTPGLDAIAAGAINYAQAVTPHPFGPFARAALLTGVASPNNGIRDYFDPLPVEARTIAHALHERGYQTAFFGKWHLGRRDPAVPLVGEAHARMIIPPEARGGFQFWEGFESGFQLNDPWLHGSRLAEPTRFPGYQSDVLCARAAGWLREARTAPVFAVVSLEAPHPPYDAPAGEVARRAITPDVRVPAASVERAARDLAGYHAHIEATDRAIARLVAAWPGDAALVFTSVHGDMHGAHGLFRKGWPHEESVRVPLLVRPPGTKVIHGRLDSPTGETRASQVSIIDLPAMALAWAEGRDGADSRDHARISMPSVVALPDQCDRVWRGVRTAGRKLVLNADGTPWLYFDLGEDPGELRNLVSDPARTDEISRLRALV